MKLLETFDLRGTVDRIMDEIFSEMIGMQLNLDAAATEEPLPGGSYCCSGVQVHGDLTGQIHLAIGSGFATAIAEGMLGIEAADLDEAMVNDVVGEINNMIAGNLKSELDNVGLAFRLAPPQVQRTAADALGARAQSNPNAMKPLAHRDGDERLQVNLWIKETS